ncbi:AsmA family protein [Aestuariirhabdus sp. LZHN29]|uniref:AsmA family protein n=1 Tax=Aestuariirhabdus sp. LZHN29 TaxID=3417462 RepID=UPI003CEB64CE
MKALLKVGLITLLLVIALLIAALVIIPLLVNPNDYKPQLHQLVREQSGLELVIDGDIGLSIFPTLGFELEKVALTNRGQPLAQLERARAALKLLPLLSGQVEMQALELAGLDLKLVKNARGEANWEVRTPEREGSAAPATASAPDTQPASNHTADSASKPIRLSIAEIRIQDISVHYLDQQQGSEYRLEQMSLLTGAIEPGKPFPLKLAATLNSHAPRLELQTRLTAEANVDLASQRYELHNLDLQSQLSGDATTDKTVPLSLKGNITADLAGQRVQLDNLVLELASLRATTQLNVTSMSPLTYAGNIDLPAFDLNALLNALGQPAIDTQHPDALKAIALKSGLKGDDNAIALDPISLGLDGSRFNGRIALDDIANQSLRFALKGDRFSVDDYLPPKSEQSSTAEEAPTTPGSAVPAANDQQAASKPWDDSPLLPVDALKTLDVIGELALAELISSGVTLSDASLKLSAQNGLLKLEQLKGRAFDGLFSKSATLDLNKTPIHLSATVEMNGVDVSEVLKVASPGDPAARGRAAISTRITARGNSQLKLVNSLNGTTRFSIEEGALLGTDLNRLVCRAVARVRKKTLTDPAGPEETPFKQLGGSLNIRNGVAANDDLIASMDNLKLAGKGAINLPDKALDYRLGLTIVGNGAEQDEACQINEQYADIVWPVRCKGPFDSSRSLCGIDNERMSAVLTGLATREVQKKLSDKIEEKFGTGLKGLFDKFK